MAYFALRRLALATIRLTRQVRREFKEETGNLARQEDIAAFDQMTDELFKHGVHVYRGYVDDPRNTDNAWLETSAFHFHCTRTLGEIRHRVGPPSRPLALLSRLDLVQACLCNQLAYCSQPAHIVLPCVFLTHQLASVSSYFYFLRSYLPYACILSYAPRSTHNR